MEWPWELNVLCIMQAEKQHGTVPQHVAMLKMPPSYSQRQTDSAAGEVPEVALPSVYVTERQSQPRLPPPFSSEGETRI